MYAEIGEIIAGKKAAPVDKITIFDSMGKLGVHFLTTMGCGINCL